MATRAEALDQFMLKLLEIAYETDITDVDELFDLYREAYNPRLPRERFDRWIGEAGLPVSKGRIDRKVIVPKLDALKAKLGFDVLKDANKELFDAIVRNQIFLLRMSTQQQARIIELLTKTEKDIQEAILRRLTKTGPEALGTKRLQQLMDSLALMRRAQWKEITKEWVEEVVNVAKEQSSAAAGLIKTAAPVVLDLQLPAVGQLRAIVNTNPFEGRTLKQWADTIAEQDIARMLDQIRIGLVQGESSQQIARRIVGSANLKGRDGIFEVTRRHAMSITRTAIMSTAAASREALYAENSDLFDRERYVATLDSRTTPICRSLDGKIFPLGQGPRPPVHWNCRSIRVPWFSDEYIAQRPARAFTQQQLLREFSSAEGLPRVRSRAALPRGYKTSFDEFARRRMRELTSVIPSNVDYGTWLGRQTIEFQDDILGPTRGALFRKGGLTLDKFVDATGSTRSLSNLARLHRDAFLAAGLDPEDFL